MTDITAVVSTV